MNKNYCIECEQREVRNAGESCEECGLAAIAKWAAEVNTDLLLESMKNVNDVLRENLPSAPAHMTAEDLLRVAAHAKLTDAANAMGDDFGGFSPIDLLLDNFPTINAETATRLLVGWEINRLERKHHG